MKRYLILIMMLINVIIVCAQQKPEVKYYTYTLNADEKKPQESDFIWQKVRFYAIINKDTITLFKDEYGKYDGEDYVYRRMYLLEDKIHTVGEYQYAYFKNLANSIPDLYMFDIRGGFSFIETHDGYFSEYSKYSVEEVPHVVTFKEITREEFNKADAEFIQKKGTMNW